MATIPIIGVKDEACMLVLKNALYVSRRLAMFGTSNQVLVVGAMSHVISQLQLSLEASCRLEVRSQRCD
jgi:hypothetical protein